MVRKVVGWWEMCEGGELRRWERWERWEGS